MTCRKRTLSSHAKSKRVMHKVKIRFYVANPIRGLCNHTMEKVPNLKTRIECQPYVECLIFREQAQFSHRKIIVSVRGRKNHHLLFALHNSVFCVPQGIDMPIPRNNYPVVVVVVVVRLPARHSNRTLGSGFTA